MFKKVFVATRAIILILPFAFIIVFLNGCSTLNKNECLNADWQTIGYQDGYKGYPQSRIGQHRKACAEYGVAPVLESYLSGYQKGLNEFCKPHQGYRRGLLGYINKDVCKGPMRNPYNRAHLEGKIIYGLEQQIKEITTTLNELVDKNHQLEHARLSAEHKLINDKLTKDERAYLVNRIREIDAEMQSNTDDIKDYEKNINDFRNETEYLKNKSTYK